MSSEENYLENLAVASSSESTSASLYVDFYLGKIQIDQPTFAVVQKEAPHSLVHHNFGPFCFRKRYPLKGHHDEPDLYHTSHIRNSDMDHDAFLYCDY